MKVGWMILYFKEQEISEHKTYEVDQTHYFRSLEFWDYEVYPSEELALQVLSEYKLDPDDRVLIHKVYVK